MLNNLQQMHLKLLTVSKREIQKTAKVTSDSSGNKIADRTKV